MEQLNCQEFILKLPNDRQYGPFLCPHDAEIAEHLLHLSEIQHPKIDNSRLRVKLPRNLNSYIHVVVYPNTDQASSTVDAREQEEVSEPTIVYAVKCAAGERLTKTEILNQLRENYSQDVIGERCLCVFTLPECDRQISDEKHSNGTIFTAKEIDSSISHCSFGIPYRVTPPTLTLTLPLTDTADTVDPLTEDRSGQPKTDVIVAENQNLAYPSSPSSDDDVRKFDQVVPPETSCLEQKPSLKNVEELAGHTGLQNLLVTVCAEEQNQLSGPQPCKEKLPTIVLNEPAESSDVVGSSEQNVRPEKESSTSGHSRIENVALEPIERVRSSSDFANMVAPKLPKSLESMVTGMRLLVPKKENEQNQSSSCENLCVNNLDTKNVLSLSVLPNNRHVHSASDDNLYVNVTAVQQCDEKRVNTKITRRHSTSDLGIPVQQLPSVSSRSGHPEFSEAVIPMRGSPTRALSARRSQSFHTATLEEVENGTKSEAKETNDKQILQEDDDKLLVLPSRTEAHPDIDNTGVNASTPKTEGFDFVLNVASQSRSTPRDQVNNERLKNEGREEEDKDQCDVANTSQLTKLVPSDENKTGDIEGQALETGLTKIGRNQPFDCQTENGSESQLTSHEISMQAHILEHVCNGSCGYGAKCPQPPSAEHLAQMANMLDAHENGSLNPAMTNLLKMYITFHCSKCRNKKCNVQHMAAGCQPPCTSFSTRPTNSLSTSSKQPNHDTPSPLPPSCHPANQSTHYHGQRQISSISFDPSPYQRSTSEDVREYERQMKKQLHVQDERRERDNQLPDDEDHSSSHDKFEQFRAQSQNTSTAAPNTHATNTHPNNLLAVQRPMSLRFLRGENHQSETKGILASPSDERENPAGETTSNNDLLAGQSGIFYPGAMQNLKLHRGGDERRKKGLIFRHSNVCHPTNATDDHQQPCYIIPGRSSNDPIRYHREWMGLPDVRRDGCFPHVSRYQNVQPGVFVYCSEELTSLTGLNLGTTLPLPDTSRLKQLGTGGNGKVYQHTLNNYEFAIKLTSYRQNELDTWLRLDHENIVPLLGVMWQRENKCFQFMPLMTTDLSSVMKQSGDLYTLASNGTEKHWTNVMFPNVQCVLKQVLMGLQYLHKEGIQHCDLKSSNILVAPHSSCHCLNILYCTCTSKCEIRLADFDSVKKFDPNQIANTIPDTPCKPKSAKVLGTPYYRAPEQFKEVDRMNVPATWGATQEQHNVDRLEGPWCDVWSLGVIITQLCLGKSRDKEKEMVSHMMVSTPTPISTSSPNTKPPTPEIEGLVTRERLSSLRAKCCPRLTTLKDMAGKCLETDFKKRVTVDELLRNDLFVTVR